MTEYNDLAEIINSIVASDTNLILTIEENGEKQKFSYPEFKRLVLAVAGLLAARGLVKGQKVMIVTSSVKSLIIGLWGVIISGAQAVPVSAPINGSFNDDKAERLNAIAEIAAPNMIVTDNVFYGKVCGILPGCRDKVISINSSELTESEYCSPKIDNSDPAMIVFTSGSTNRPKGVVLSHGNIISGINGNIRYASNTRDKIFLNWMPLDHVAALVMFHIQQTALRAFQIQVATGNILADIKRWLKYLSDYKVNTTWAPNFAFEQLLHEKDKILDMDITLENVTEIDNAGEAINYRLCDECMKVLMKKELSYAAMTPCWGMTEASTGILYSKKFGKIVFENTVASGTPIPGMEVRLYSDGKVITEENIEGHFEIRGGALFEHYLNEETVKTDSWFDTGDIAVWINGEIVITGRSKEMLIVNGLNISCLEIESYLMKELENVDDIKNLKAIAVRNADTSHDELLIFIDTTKCKDVFDVINSKLTKKYQIGCGNIFAVEEFPRTAIGKIDRKKLIENYKCDVYDKLASSTQDEQFCVYSNSIEERAADIWKNVLNVSEVDFRTDKDFFLMGGTSAQLPILAEKLSEAMGTEISVADILEHPTVKGLCEKKLVYEEHFEFEDNMIVL